MIRPLVQRLSSQIFWTSFAIVVAAQVVTIVIAWLLLGANINGWIAARVAQTLQIAQYTASQSSWDRIDKIPENDDSALGDNYASRLKKLSEKYFHRNEGQVYLVVVDRGEEYNILGVQSPPLSDAGDKANPWELRAYATRRVTYTPEPISDNNGTYVAAYIPILRAGKVLGLVAAEYDSATLSDLRSVVFTAFWKSIIPGIVFSLFVANILAWKFVDPEDVLRSTAGSAREEKARALKGAVDEPWNSLTDRELEVAELAGDGLKIKEMAERLVVGTETIKTHLKNIKDKTGLSKVQLGFKVQARRIAAAPDATL